MLTASAGTYCKPVGEMWMFDNQEELLTIVYLGRWNGEGLGKEEGRLEFDVASLEIWIANTSALRD